MKTPVKTPKTVWIAVLALIFFAGSAAAGDWGRETEDYRETFALSAGGEIVLENINGDVTVEAWDRDEVEVAYTKRARTREGLERVEVVIEERGGRLDIETEYLRNGRSNDGGSVDFTLQVPRKAYLELDLVNGSLKVTGHEGRISADLVNGSLEAEIAGEAELSTVNGKMDVTVTDTTAGQRLELDSVNGGLTLRLPAGVDADVEAETVHGSISNDFGIPVDKGRYVGRSMRGTIGGGGVDIELSNVNGSIKILSE